MRQLRKTVTRNASRLTEKLEKNTDKKYIPEPLKKPLAEFLSTVNFTSKAALQNRGIVKANRNYIDALRALKDILTKEGFEQGEQEETKKVTSSGSIDLPNGFKETINNHLQAVQKILDENGNREYVINAMGEEELETLNMVLNVTSRAVTTIDELFANKRYQKVSQMAHATFAHRGKKPKFDPTLEGFKAFLSWWQMTPTFALREYGPGGEAIVDSLKESLHFFTKALTKNANNSIMLWDIFNVFSNHMTDMAKYNTMVLPLMDAMKFFNYRESSPLTADPEDTGIRERSVQNEIKRAYGNEGKNYFLKLIQDLNGTDEGGRGEEWTKKLVSNYKRAAVSANLRVAIQQPAAIFRATYVIPYKYLANAVAEKTNMKEAIKEMEKNSGIAKCRANGFFDMDVGFGVRDQIKHAESKLNKAIDASMKPAEWGDREALFMLIFE